MKINADYKILLINSRNTYQADIDISGLLLQH